MTVARLIEIVRQLPDGLTEVNTHPGASQCAELHEECSREDREFLLSPHRRVELNALLDPALRRELAASDVHLVRFRDVLGSHELRQSTG
jgi:hypothetical protein